MVGDTGVAFGSSGSTIAILTAHARVWALFPLVGIVGALCGTAYPRVNRKYSRLRVIGPSQAQAHWQAEAASTGSITNESLRSALLVGDKVGWVSYYSELPAEI